ncbi:MAG: acyltransferase [Acidimicrobiia bacterium]|nr:acyltransferase [Acidimicrobiia bacterium]
MKKYLTHTKRLALATPPERNRVVDFWRAVAILVVVFGHWLAASIWLTPDGGVELMNSLEWVPVAGWLTWVVQVMPIFFLAGGYANARGLTKVERGEETRRAWIATRARRLFTPVIPLLLAWVALILILRPFVAADVVRAGAMSATLPLWFLAVYLMLTAMAPFTFAWWRRWGAGSVVALLGAAVAVDVVRFAFDVPGIGWVNFVFVWGAVHQVGYLWSSLDTGRGASTRTGWAVAAAALGLLVGLTGSGLYPVAMLGIPGAGVTNMTPPTIAMFILGMMQLGFIWATQPAVRRFTSTGRNWHIVVSLSGVIMTVYLWHLSAMSLLAAGGLFAFDGALFSIEPASPLWWITRPLWLATLALVTLALTAVFARFEWNVNKKPTPQRVTTTVLGLLLSGLALARVALVGLADAQAGIDWLVPVLATAGAVALGAVPAHRRQKRSQSGTGREASRTSQST